MSIQRVYTAKELGALVRQARRSRHLTQLELAAHANLSRSAVQRLEAGRGAANLATAFKLLHILALDLAVARRGGTDPGARVAR